MTEGAAPALPSRWRFAALSRLWAWFRDNAAEERDRWPLFAPVAMGCGVGLYFALPAEPDLWPLLAVIAAAGALAWVGFRRYQAGAARFAAGLVIAGLVAALIGVGLAAAKIHTLSVAAPILERRTPPVTIEGRIAAVEDRPVGQRIILENAAIPGVASEKTPERLRVSVRAREQDLYPGLRVTLRAILGPPPAPAMPGAYDFERAAFFDRIGGVGFALGKADVLAPEPGGPASAWTAGRLWLENLRHEIAARVSHGMGGEEGPIAAALMTGHKGAISADVIEAMRNSGLAHLLAVSGFHFVLICGFVFFVVRAGLALVPPLALHFPIKKWAAVAGLASAAGYFAITGDSIATQRAFIMISLVFIAVLVERTAISMRTLAWAAAIVLLVNPESMLGASFQLSFAAVAALIAAYEGWGTRWLQTLRTRDDDATPSSRVLRILAIYLGGILLTTVIATAATAPLLAYNFNRLASYGLIGNLFGVPVTAIWTMPWALAAFALMPFGLEQIALTPMGWGVTALIWVAKTTSDLPAAVVIVKAMPPAAIVTIVAGGLWLCLWQRPWRLAGIPVILLGVALAFTMRPPDILVDENAKLVSVRAADGTLVLSSLRAAKFSADTWLRRSGATEAEAWPKSGSSPDGRLTCDSLGCLYRARGQTAALAREEAALWDDCAAADIVVSLVPVRRGCRGPEAVIDRFDLWRNGSYAVWLDPDSIRVESVRQWQGRRPWVLDRSWKALKGGKGD